MLSNNTANPPFQAAAPAIPAGAVLIPCKFNFLTGLFEPLLTVWEAFPHLCKEMAASKEETEIRRESRSGKWSKEEDERLMVHVEIFGKQAWAQISRELNNDYHLGKAVRLGKHCRERWYNHLDPFLKSTPYVESEWNDSEDQLLFSLHQQFGNCWSKIARKIPGRTENHVKNRWNSLVKKSQGKKEDGEEITVEMNRAEDDSLKELGIIRPLAVPAARTTVQLC